MRKLKVNRQHNQGTPGSAGSQRCAPRPGADAAQNSDCCFGNDISYVMFQTGTRKKKPNNKKRNKGKKKNQNLIFYETLVLITL